ncbi:hypothetical protein ACTOB_001255 [Actinoplanes oblitus]|uniref:Uncharacterized protein n=1 Tax=Actinoplanes oblitus TaxID=3040509 RepID=A0ABY8WLJ8_9ACTN|nr:hypothetical protein [Actinoplanes oblitus]WIM97707.1 hypothetical protein ACTOB_001255 [Actinoplanes oblitus]
MFVTYSPEDGDQQRWEFNPDRVRQSKAEMIEKRYGANWDQFRAGVQSGDSRARRVLLWHLMSMEHPAMRIEDVPDFCMGELKVEHSRGELVMLRDRLAKANIPESDREQMLTALDIEITDAMASEADEGKATSNSAD